MKKLIKVLAITIGVLVVIVIIWIAIVSFSFAGVHQYVPDTIYSDDGTRVIIPTINYNNADPAEYLNIYFEIRETQSDKTLLKVQTHASDRMKWAFHWIGNSFIRLDSSDIGSFCWKEEQGYWGEITCP